MFPPTLTAISVPASAPVNAVPVSSNAPSTVVLKPVPVITVVLPFLILAVATSVIVGLSLSMVILTLLVEAFVAGSVTIIWPSAILPVPPVMVIWVLVSTS